MTQYLTSNSIHIQSRTPPYASPPLSFFNRASLYCLHTTVLLPGTSVMGFRVLLSLVCTQLKIYCNTKPSGCLPSHPVYAHKLLRHVNSWINKTNPFLSDTLFFKYEKISFCVPDKWEVLAFRFTTWQRKSNRSRLSSRTHQKRVR